MVDLKASMSVNFISDSNQLNNSWEDLVDSARFFAISIGVDLGSIQTQLGSEKVSFQNTRVFLDGLVTNIIP